MEVWGAHALACVEVTGQLCELSSIFLPSCAFWSLNSVTSRKRFYPLNHLALPVDSSCGMALHKLRESQCRRQCPGAKDKDDQQ